jgi:hypothetical protein
MGYHRRVSLLVSAAIVMAGPTWAVAQAPRQKVIHAISDTRPLQLSVSAAHREFKVEEPIALRIELDRPAYVYVYDRGSDGRSRFVYPAQDDRETKLAAGVQVLHSGAADAPGEEQLAVFASELPLNLSDEDRGDRGLPTAEFERRLAAVGVPVTPGGFVDSTGVISAVQILPVKIAGETSRAPESAEGIALVATDKTSYRVGEPLQLVFGANRAGYVQLFVRYPGGRIERLLTQKFDAPGVVTRSATAELPGGEQSLLAVYSADGRLTPRMLRDAGVLGEDGADKAVKLRDAPGVGDFSISSRTIKVEE